MSEVFMTPSSTCDVYVYKDWGGRIVVQWLDKEAEQPFGSTYAYDYRYKDSASKKSFLETLTFLRELILKGYKIPNSDMAIVIGKVNKIPDSVLFPPVKEEDNEYEQ